MNKKIPMILLCGLMLTNVGFAKPTKVEQQKAVQLYQAGQESYRNGDYKSAADAFLQASKLDEENPMYSLFAADILRGLKQYPSSIRHYEAAIKNINHGRKTLREQIEIRAYTGIVKCYIKTKEADKAKEYSQKLIDKYKDNFEGYLMMGNTIAMNEDGYKTSITWYQQAIEKDKEALEPYLYLARIYNKLKDIPNVIKIYEQACDYRPIDEKMKMSLAQVYLSQRENQDNVKNAIRILKSLLNVNPRHVEGQYYLGLSYALIGDMQKAENQIGIVNNLNPNLGDRLFRELRAYQEKNAPKFEESNVTNGEEITISVGEAKQSIKDESEASKMIDEQLDSMEKDAEHVQPKGNRK